MYLKNACHRLRDPASWLPLPAGVSSFSSRNPVIILDFVVLFVLFLFKVAFTLGGFH